MRQATGGIGVAVDVDQRAVELVQHDGDGIERWVEGRNDLILIRREGDVRWHVENDAVATARHRNAGSLQLGAKLGFLAVHVVADRTTCERTDTSADKRSIAATDRRTADSKTPESTDNGADAGATCRVRHLLLARIGIGRGAGGKISAAKGDDRDFFDHVSGCSERFRRYDSGFRAIAAYALFRRVFPAKTLFDVIDHQRLKISGDVGAAQGERLFAIDENRCRWALTGAGQRNADIGVFAFAGAIDDAAHDGDVERLDTGIFLTPGRHVLTNVVLDVLGELLEDSGRGPSTAGTCRNDWNELTETHHLQQFLSHLHLTGTVAIRLGRERYADRVANAMLQHITHGGGGGDDALRTHARLGQAQMQGVVGSFRQHRIDGDQVLNLTDFSRQDDAIARQADLFGKLGGNQR
ncbi:hypothetical protein AT6N2_C2742 [Agrobacterium tumefaciens]|nr:hypothetical protein AT6N2_C2742 [Agrobacterium tumefaciens]